MTSNIKIEKKIVITYFFEKAVFLERKNVSFIKVHLQFFNRFFISSFYTHYKLNIKIKH